MSQALTILRAYLHPWGLRLPGRHSDLTQNSRVLNQRDCFPLGRVAHDHFLTTNMNALETNYGRSCAKRQQQPDRIAYWRQSFRRARKGHLVLFASASHVYGPSVDLRQLLQRHCVGLGSGLWWFGVILSNASGKGTKKGM